MLGAPKVARRAGAQGSATEIAPQQWEQGTGWGWVWGDDEVGNLNELSPELALKALSLVERGQVYDLGLTYARDSYKFEGHNPGEVMSFRTSSGGDRLRRPRTIQAEPRGTKGGVDIV
jgi:hypothetical protein